MSCQIISSSTSITVLLTALFSVTFVLSSPTGAPQSGAAKVAALKQALAQNQAELKVYAWTETTEIRLKGDVKKQEQKDCHYGPDGKVQKVPIEDAGQPAQKGSSEDGRQRGGRLKKAIAKSKVDEMKDYMAQVTALVHEYVPPDPQKIQAAQAAGDVSIELSPIQSVSAIALKNYEKPGDSVSLTFDSTTKNIRTYDVKSYLDKPGNVVSLTVTFASLTDGTNHAQQAVVKAPAKQIQVTVTNSGYRKTSAP